MNNRIIFSDNGTLRDLSVALDNYYSQEYEVPLVADDDYIYIGCKLPFNHIYFKLKEPNNSASVPLVDYWDGKEWIETVEVVDQTEGMTQSGYMQWVPDKRKAWISESTNYESDTIDGLEDVVIYDLYWIRISFSEDFDEDFSITWLGNKFADDSDLGAEFPDLNRANVLEDFEEGKQDWEEQHVKAAAIMINDLIDKGIIVEKGQILDWRNYIEAAVMKCAEIIYRSFGDDYKDDQKASRDEYKVRLSNKINRVDRNKNAIEDVSERFTRTGWLSR